MNINKTRRVLTIIATLAILSSLFSSALAAPGATTVQAPSAPVSFTILHTNDFHGQLQASGSNPGMARTAAVINGVRTSMGAANVLLVDAGDEMQGSLLSNLQKGAPTIATFNAMDYDVATFGNHEFDWGQTVLATRTTEAAYPYVTANIVQNNTGNCATAGWTPPAFADAPYQLIDVGDPVSVKVAFIGVTTAETPTITIASATDGLCFKDPADSIIHYYDAMKAAGADVIVVLSHLGYTDGGYGYGLPVYGDKTLAQKLITAGKPANLIIGGHSHTNMLTQVPPLPAGYVVGPTTVGQAYYNGRQVGRANITVGTDGSVAITWASLAVSTSGAVDVPVQAVINTYALDPAYLALIGTEIGYTNVPIVRNYDGDSLMGYFVNDAIYNDLNNDVPTANDVDMVFNNAGGLRADIACAAPPCLITFGNTFDVLPFGNQTIVGDMRGDKILELLHQSATLFKGAIQPSGIRYSFFRYSDALPGPQPYGWGAYDVTVYDNATSSWVPLDLTKTYRVATNEFLAPAGQDGFTPFKYMTNISYWGDMLDGVNRYVKATYPSSNPYNGALDGRITRNGDGDNAYEAGEIVPLTILHHNDSHGNLDKTGYVGYTQLATLIKQEKLHNASRTLLLSSGDNIQGDAMSFYFKTAPTGFASDGTAIADPTMHIQPLIKAFNAMSYDAMVLGNHEFNFGSDIFTSVLSQATFPLLQANVEEDPGDPYGLAVVGVEPYVEKDLGDIDVAILGIGNHRIPNYELPSNIPGLTFSDPIAKAQELSDSLRPTNDVVIALTHIGFTENPASVEVDANVDTNLVANVTGLDALVGGHSHTDPAVGFGAYKYLPSVVSDPNGAPVIVGHAYRYNNTLGELSLGLRPLGGGDYEVVSQTGRYVKPALADLEDPEIDAIVTPYTNMLTAYNNTVIGSTTTPIDTTNAYIAETNAANLQADAAIYELASHGITDVDFHLSGAMTRPSSSANWVMFPTATVGTPASMSISNMFTLMPYENSLVVLEMNGPQLKAVLERAYRNYYYYKYVPGYGGYSYYTTCMIDTNFGNQITYNDQYPTLPNGNNVVSLEIGGVPVDFTDATTTYNVSTVNYLAAGSCNFNNGGVSLWPLGSIVYDTQYYVRDAVINYATHEGIISPAVEGRLVFNYTISGNAGVGGATVNYTGGSTTAGGTGYYSFSVPGGWTGTITPSKTGYFFTPASATISTAVTANLTQNFAATSSAFVKYSPAIGASGVSTSPLLNWGTSSGATSYEYCIDTSNDTVCDTGWVSRGTNKSVGLSGLAENTTYYWQVHAINADGTVEANGGAWWNFTTMGCYTLTKSGNPSGSVNASPAPNCTGGKYLAGTVVQLTPVPAYGYVFSTWSGDLSGSVNPSSVTMDADKSVTANFILPPAAFVKYSVANGATGVSTSPLLNWQTSSGATSYEYCIDTSNDTICDTGWVNRGNNKDVTLSGLAENTTYYWQVHAINADGTVEANGGAWWNFTTMGCYTLTKSGNPSGSVNASPAPNCTGGKYLAGTVVQLTPVPAYGYVFSTWSGDLTGSANPGSVTMSADRSVTANFILPPAAFSKYNPTNGLTGISTNPLLNWGTSANATSYEYCIDTSNNDTCNASWVSRGSNKSVVLSGLTGTQTYYWQVRAVNADGTTYANGGTWWSFTTVAVPGAFTKYVPTNGNASVTITGGVLMNWATSANATSYEYCIDTTNDGICNTSWVSRGALKSVVLTTLSANNTYYWQARAVNASGATYANTGSWWSFTTVP